ncbi:MAG: hypothetical protein U9N31_08730 [Candidatus Marinimicrobia bacterium]|nr:hypothetical protein [Candidatus Neomarinimicrobiota bacterium]
MHLNKTDGFTIGFILIAGTAILVNGYVKKDNPQKNPVIKESFTFSEEFDYPTELTPSTPEIALEEFKEFNDEPTEVVMTFAEAFAEARRINGPVALFEWNGKSYTTSFAEEIVNPGEKVDSTEINLVLNQPPEK